MYLHLLPISLLTQILRHREKKYGHTCVISPGCDHPGGVVPFYFSKKKKSPPSPGRSNRPLPVQTVPLTLDFEIWRTLWPLVARQKHCRALRTHTGSNLCRCFLNPWSFMLVRSSWVKMGRMGRINEAEMSLQKAHFLPILALGCLINSSVATHDYTPQRPGNDEYWFWLGTMMKL